MYNISISGKANSGKNTLSKMLSDQLFKNGLDSDRAIKNAFANPIKKIILLMFPQSDRQCLYGPSGLRSNVIPDAYDSANNPLTYRQALIDIGSKGREYNKNIWINILKEDIKNADSYFMTCEATGYFVTDVRYLNEFKMLKKLKFFNIRILRNMSVKINHQSEFEQDVIPNDDFDYVINNDGSLKDLSKQVDKLIVKLKRIQGHSIL